MFVDNAQATNIDSLTIATIWHYFQRVCVDMRETMERTASNVVATTLHDLAYGIWDANARPIAIPEGFPPRLISSTYPIKAVIKKYHDRIYPGDQFLTNHPFESGAVHLPDWLFIRPIFYEDELVFFSCMGTHVLDNGGAHPGVHYLAHDPIAEGLNIPPVKIMGKGKVQEDVIDLILANNRLPQMMRREIFSLTGSTSVAGKRLVELMNRYGRDTVLASVEEMMKRTEKAVRDKVSKWPEGTYYSESQVDNDGAGDQPVTVRCKLTVADGEATFDFSESDPQVKGFVNAVYPVTLSNTLCTIFLFLGTELAAFHNEGSLKPFRVVTKKGTVTDCTPGCLTASTPGTLGSVIIECVLSVMSQMLPESAIASYGRQPTLGGPIGIDTRNNQPYVYASFSYTGGAGAVSGYDGYQCACNMGTLGVVSKTDVEEEMVRFPWRTRRYEFLLDSCGAGKWRGAPGIWWEVENEGGECTNTVSRCMGWTIGGQGQLGGHPTPFNKAFIEVNNVKKDMADLPNVIRMKTGDAIISMTGGGAGVGRPEDRDPEMVRMDVKNDLVSLNVAKDIYKVVLDPDSLEIDWKATKEIRECKLS